jgi:thymidine phosphorylase
MLIQDFIRKKRDNQTLSTEEIEIFVKGITDETVTEGQVSAFAMATYFRDLSLDECVALTRAMKNSGETLQWDSLNLSGPVVDKHSSGGVGDKPSLMMAPMLAACGAFVPMISGRGLGHTGGTLDKLDSIPGYNTSPDIDQFQSVVKQVGCAIVGQTVNLAPADKRFYAIRDVTATVESLPLIVASILSKKLSAGLSALVMDIKTGNGAFAETTERANDLASRIVELGGGLGLPVTALITDMNQVLGSTAGNAVEIVEVIDYLTGKSRDPRLHEVVISLCVESLLLCGLVSDREQACDQLNQSLDSGRAAEIFAKMTAALGGPNDLIECPQKYLPKAKVIVPVFPKVSGKVSVIDVRRVGNAIVELGGGRRRATDPIDYSVGLTDVKGIGEVVGIDTPLAIVHASDQSSAELMAEQLRQAYSVADVVKGPGPVILKRFE